MGCLMLRRSLMAMFGGAAVAPAASKAAARAEAVTGRVAMGDMASLSAPMAYGRVVGISDPESRLGRPLYNLLRRQQHETAERLNIRRQAWTMPLDPDLAAMPSCSETFLRHLQERRLRQEREAQQALEWKLWPPDWAEG